MTEQEFYQKIPEWIQEDDYSKWNKVTLLAYFCFRYKQHLKKINDIEKDFNFRKSTPDNSKESRDFTRIIKIMNPSNYEDLDDDQKREIRRITNLKIRRYIDWMFDYKLKNKAVTGTQIFLFPGMINEFDIMYEKWLKKNANQNTFEQLLAWCKDNIPLIFNQQQLERSEDLKMIKRYAAANNLNSDSLEVKLLRKAEEMRLI